MTRVATGAADSLTSRYGTETNLWPPMSRERGYDLTS